MDHYGADPTKLCVSPPGVNRTYFQPGDRSEARSRLGLGEEPLALFVGRIQALKGPDVAVASVAMARDSLENLRLLIVGGPSGPDGEREMQALRRAASDLGPDAVLFHPPVGHSRLADYYQAADVLLAPSRSESFGLVAAEAQACGLPVVAARRGGLRYVVEDGGSGLLVDGWDPQGYAAAICKVIGTTNCAPRCPGGRWNGRASTLGRPPATGFWSCTEACSSTDEPSRHHLG